MPVLENPSLEEVSKAIIDAVKKRETVLMVARCIVEYAGRSFSRLGEGDRILILKPDGSLIIHREKGYSPVNYQPEGSIVNVKVENGKLFLRSIRRRPEEIMDIYMSKVYVFFSKKLDDRALFEMWGNEEDIKRAIILEPSLLGEKFKVVKDERKMGNRGYADLLLVDENGTYVIVEIKKGTAGIDAVEQLLKYVDYYQKAIGRSVRGMLVAPNISKNALQKLEASGLEYVKIDPRKVWTILKAQKGILSFL
ncbi:MAG: endonuclease NucS [Thermoprotei archaeon]|nr:MAG: endonuclease NucS [Thermoprotei archaeon]